MAGYRSPGCSTTRTAAKYFVRRGPSISSGTQPSSPASLTGRPPGLRACETSIATGLDCHAQPAVPSLRLVSVTALARVAGDSEMPASWGVRRSAIVVSLFLVRPVGRAALCGTWPSLESVTRAVPLRRPLGPLRVTAGFLRVLPSGHSVCAPGCCPSLKPLGPARGREGRAEQVPTGRGEPRRSAAAAIWGWQRPARRRARRLRVPGRPGTASQASRAGCRRSR
jgi:hypothetical protein